jgi:PD-(D/E)XK endonuclease
MTTNQKGAVAELAIALAAVKLGVEVYRPLAEGGRSDLIFEVDGRLLRVQCKWASRRGEAVVVRCYSSRRNRAGLLRRIYAAGEIDAFAAYCPELDRCYFLPYELFEGRTEINLRLTPTPNNQQLKVNWASSYEFEATLSGDPGAIAQLGERRRGTPKVTGSNPVGSTHRARRRPPGATGTARIASTVPARPKSRLRRR